MPIPTSSILALSAGVLYHMIMGCLYLHGTISIYLSSYYHQFDPSMNTRFLISFLPLRGVFLAFCLPYGTYLGKKYGPRFTTLLGGGIVILCTTCLIFITNKYLFLIVYSCTFGLCTINFMPPIICSWKHFPTNRGTVSGIVIGGFSLAPLIFNFIVRSVVNPNDLRPTITVQIDQFTDYYYVPEVANNVPKMFLTLLIIWSLMLIFIYYSLVDPQTNVVANSNSDDSIDMESIHDSFLLSSMIILYYRHTW